MSLVIPDAELRTISGEVISLPALIVALNLQLVQAQAGKDETELKDNGNKVFYDYYHGIVNAYHAERPHISSLSNTAYLDQTLDDSAQQKPGNLHFPASPIWVNLIPKLLAENNGNPTSNIALYEQDKLTDIPAVIAPIRTGFSDGALTDALTTAYVFGQDLEVDVGGYAIGQRIVVDALGVSLLGLITDVKPPSTTGAEDLEITVLAAPAGALGIGAQVRNFHPGWSDAEREETVALATPEVLHYFEAFIDPEIALWDTTLDNQAAGLALNAVGGAEAAQIASALANVQAAIADIVAWQAAPATGAGVGRYGDTALAPIEARISQRTTETSTRLTQISTALGSASQNPDGEFSGTGHYFSLFTWIDIRIRKGPGSLFSFYNFDIVFNFIQSQIDLATDKQTEYAGALLVKKLTASAISTTFVTIEDTTGLSISDQVKVVSDDVGEPIVTALIVDIQGLVLELDQTVVSALVSDRARVVKELL